jgi:predicted nuclease of predicted toxin-antitoxin system
VIKLATDEDFNNRILRGLLRRNSRLDIRRKQDTELEYADDPQVLAWAASEGRVLLTHDASTLIGYAYERVRQGASDAGRL